MSVRFGIKGGPRALVEVRPCSEPRGDGALFGLDETLEKGEEVDADLTEGR